ncbi:hypothetical protein HPO_17524 [Hyphomonas polymorpha PS728]|uniref:Uncharacterized protein n=1 Tax=Hyphomonas polymorpha PS728 TaxID=1280954 RepID=A0A062V9T3_9PROT|nr:hypothetical protein [Hyphomonas polymorpha]KCZ96895.1 hypothetical protein HPO_17524 [Hyphomonas polymorpha PS728]
MDISLDTLAREADWQDDSDVNIRQLFNTIFKRKWMILGIVFLGLAIGYINTLRIQRRGTRRRWKFVSLHSSSEQKKPSWQVIHRLNF